MNDDKPAIPTEADQTEAYRIVERMGMGYEFRMCSCGQLPCARLQPIATALAAARRKTWEKAIEVVKTSDADKIFDVDACLRAALVEVLEAAAREGE